MSWSRGVSHLMGGIVQGQSGDLTGIVGLLRRGHLGWELRLRQTVN